MVINFPKDLAIMVKNRRKALKLSQKAAADLVGLKQATWSAFENKPENSKIDTLFRILSAVNLKPDVIEQEKLVNKSESNWKEEW